MICFHSQNIIAKPRQTRMLFFFIIAKTKTDTDAVFFNPRSRRLRQKTGLTISKVVVEARALGGLLLCLSPRRKARNKASCMAGDYNAAAGCRRSGKAVGWRALLLAITTIICCIGEVGGWIALSKDGYKITRRLLLNNGSRIEGDILINGVIQSSKYTWLGPKVEDPDTCDFSKEGAVRWNYETGDLEGCDTLKYQPLRFCDRDCGFDPAPLQSLRPASKGGNLACMHEHAACPIESLATSHDKKT